LLVRSTPRLGRLRFLLRLTFVFTLGSLAHAHYSFGKIGSGARLVEQACRMHVTTASPTELLQC
jgi:hypothetical protein